MTSEQPHPPHPPHPPHQFHQPWPLPSSPAERPKTGILQPQEHTMQTLDNHQTPGVQLSAVDTYASYLKSVYRREKLPIYDKWPQVKSKKYINLALIEMDDITKPEAYQFMRATIHGNIDELSLWFNSIEVKGATAFAKMLRTNHTLVYLNLGHCNIESDGAYQLASVLHTNDKVIWGNFGKTSGFAS